MFKPPLAAVGQFRKTFPEALSDFVDILCAEDGGFAIKVFTNVSWESDGIFTTEHSAIAMANCFFTGPGAKETKVKKTFGYAHDNAGNLKTSTIYLCPSYHPDLKSNRQLLGSAFRRFCFGLLLSFNTTARGIKFVLALIVIFVL
ncbi:MAG: hypothetical protein AAGL17_06345 [Cyanobacteria bacterium J06576_12]